MLHAFCIDFAKKLPPNRLPEAKNPPRQVKNRLQIVWRTPKRCPKAKKTAICFFFLEIFASLWIFVPPKSPLRVAKRPQERSERRPEGPRSGLWESQETARDAQETILKSPKSMQKQQKCDCGFQSAFRRISRRR